MKGLICIKTTSTGRGYAPDFESYINSKTNFIGDGLNNEHISHNTLNFSILNNELYYKKEKINFEKYSHLLFIYCAELLTDVIYEQLLEIENLVKTKNIYIFNPVSRAKYDYDKIAFFDLLKTEQILVPDYFIINTKKALNEVPFNYPYLIRTNIDWGGNNLFLVNNDNERNKYYEKLISNDQTISKNHRSVNTKYFATKVIMAVKYYDPFIKELDCNLNCRILMIGANILLTLCDPFPKNMWTHRGTNDIPNNVANFEHVLMFKQEEELVPFFTKCSKYLINIVNANINFFKHVQQIIGLHTITMDFVINNNNIILLECGLKIGISPHKVPQTIKYSENNFNYYKEYQNNNIRNAKLYNYFSSYPRQNIYIDIDGTIANNIERIKKWSLPKWPLNKNKNQVLDNKYNEDLLIDTPIEYSNEIINMLYEHYNIIFITARNNYYLTKKWLLEYKYYHTELILADMNKKIDIMAKDSNFYYFIDDFTKGYEYGSFILRKDMIEKIKKLKLNYCICNNNWYNILDYVKPNYKYIVNNNITITDIYDGYICIHNKNTMSNDINLTIFVVTIGGPQLEYAINSINNIKNIPFIVHFIKNISPTSLAYQIMNTMVTTKYFIQLDEDMILSNLDYMITEAIPLLQKDSTIFNVCFRLKDDLLGITKDKYLYGIKFFNSVLMKNIIYSNGISSVDRELNFRMEKINKKYILSKQIVGYHAKYRDNFEVMLKYAKMTNSLLLNNIQPSTIDLMRIFDILNNLDIMYYYKIAIKKWNIGKNDFEKKYKMLIEKYNLITNKKFIEYGFKKNKLEKVINKNRIESDNIYYGIYGFLFALLIGFNYDFNYYPLEQYNLIKKV